MMTILTYDHYRKNIVPKLQKVFAGRNIMSIPKLEKVVVNCGLGEALKDKKVVESMALQLSLITGQKPRENHASKAISTFKLREGDLIGLKVTLRGKKMYEFVTKLVTLALPRVRDFRGIPLSSFDGNGNYTLGIKEQNIFPEIEYKHIDKLRGFEITFVTNAKNDSEGLALLKELGLPFEKENK